MTDSALRLVGDALARGIAPDRRVRPSEWARTTLIVPDGPLEGELWDPSLTPQLIEILDCLGPDDPCTRVSVRKSAQVGFTQVGIAWLGSIIDNTPAKTLVVFPTIDLGDEFNAEKLHPTLEATAALRRRVAEARSRSARASTTRKKRFPGGTITITGANSSADLRSKTVKFGFADEIDDWPLDLNKQGDPMAMFDARFRAFLRVGGYKKLEGSTPTIKGISRIDAAFEAGDQRYWHVRCPHCDEEQRLEFRHLKFEKSYPHNAHYVCPHCGCVIEASARDAMVRAGRWVATKPGPGRHPSFHLDTLTSLLVTWDDIAAAWIDAQGDPKKLKTFVNLWLGESWEERGEAPEWERLFARRESYAVATVPIGGLVITSAVDVQMKGLFFETVAWGVGKESWSIDAGFLPGDTADADSSAWRALAEVYERRYADAYGNAWPIELMAIDSGYNTNAVKWWCRGRPNAMVIKGEDGWGRPPLGTPSRQDIDYGGRKIRRGSVMWPVGTWPLKAELYALLRKPGLRDGADHDPPGYCHFTEALHDDAYFKQLTAEYLVDRVVKGRSVKEWAANGDNHFHDCRVYNLALAYHLGIDRMTMDDWARLAAMRNLPPPKLQGDLFAAGVVSSAAPQKPATASVEPPAEAPRREGRSGYLGSRAGRGSGWLGRR